MYGVRTNKDGTISLQFQRCVDHFLDFAYKHANNIEGETINGVRVLLIRCPCSTCKNRYYKKRGVVDCHLTSQGFIPAGKYNFNVQRRFPPDGIPLEKWERMFLNTEEWQKKSEAGKNNRKNDLCIHTGGSIGFDEHRDNMEKEEGKKVGFRKVFFQTHATKECKKRVAYTQQLKKMYPEETECDDLAIWESLNPKRKGGNLFGVGTSDPHFVVTGTPSSTTYASYDDARQSQELKKVQAELEKEREARKNMEARFAQWEQEREQERAERERERAANAVWQKKMEEMMNSSRKK
ncbi:putative transposase, Ptta/En/Spm, plant, Transposase-associated domain-containing protein [Helianthus anomalus]